MQKVKIYLPDECFKHDVFWKILETSERLTVLQELFSSMGLEVSPVNKCLLSNSLNTIFQVHNASYVSLIKKLSTFGLVRSTMANLLNKQIQLYTRISPETYEAAVTATQAVCTAVAETLRKKTKKSFCAVRPPGHHAGIARAEGFCVFNNVAIAGKYALSSGLSRVAIVDFDRHHGNGTMQIVSTYQNRLFLASSFEEKCKYSENARDSMYAITAPIPANSSYRTVEKIYNKRILPALRNFKPELIILSAGFDMHDGDPLTTLRLSSNDFYKLTRLLVDFADEFCKGRVVSVLEGGYELEALSRCVRAHVTALSE